MNPTTVNTTNIATFGFKVVADLELRKLLFDITGLTIFNGGGASNVVGICFEVVDPAGVPIHQIDFGSVDIDPDVASTFSLDLPSGIALFGNYKIKGQIKDQDAQIYTVELPQKEICEPKNWDGTNAVGSFKETVDCKVPFIRLNETTDLNYLGKMPVVKTKNGNLYYPQGTLAAHPFTRTPYQTSEVYTGDYTVRNKTIADYDLGDYFYVRIGYKTSYKFTLTCQERLCDIACCLEDVYNEYKLHCTTARGKQAREKIDNVSPLVFIAASLEKCGKDSSAYIKLIKDALHCQCGDCGSTPVEPVPISAGGGSSFVFDPSCAATLVKTTEGGVDHYAIKVKNVIVRKAPPGDDLAWTITKEEDDCNIFYSIAFNYDVLGANIYTATANNPTLLTQFNNLVQTIGIGALLNGLDGKCVTSLNSCNYSQIVDFAVLPATVAKIIIDGTTYNAPGGLNMSNAAGIQSWLNGLSKGAWSVAYSPNLIPPGGALQIVSVNNTHTIGTITFNIGSVDSVVAFISDCKNLKDILQAIIDYLCNLSTAQIVLAGALTICRYKGGFPVNITVQAGFSLHSFLQMVEAAFCSLVEQINSITAVNCAAMKLAFPVSDEEMQPGDVIFMTRNGTCARGTIKDLILFAFSMANTDSDVNAAFCAINCAGGGACHVITDFESTTTAV